MAFALLLADKQWGGYTSDASAQITAILNKEVSSSNVFLPDDSGNQSTDVNPSYFAPAYYKAFQTATRPVALGPGRRPGLHDAEQVRERHDRPRSRLVRAVLGRPQHQSRRSDDYGYDAARTPFRIALDACWNAEARAVTLPRQSRRVLQRRRRTSIVDGYNLDGTQAPA